MIAEGQEKKSEAETLEQGAAETSVKEKVLLKEKRLKRLKEKEAAGELTEEERKELRRRRRALKKKRMEKKKALEEARVRALLEDEEVAAIVETEEERLLRLYTRGQKKMRFAPHMYRREDQADMYRQATELFAKVPGYEQADAFCETCRQQAKEYRALYVAETCAQIQTQLTQARTLAACQKIKEKLDAIEALHDVSKERAACDALEQRLLKKQKNKKIFKYFCFAVVILVFLFVLFYIQTTPFFASFF